MWAMGDPRAFAPAKPTQRSSKGQPRDRSGCGILGSPPCGERPGHPCGPQYQPSPGIGQAGFRPEGRTDFPCSNVGSDVRSGACPIDRSPDDGAEILEGCNSGFWRLSGPALPRHKDDDEPSTTELGRGPRRRCRMDSTGSRKRPGRGRPDRESVRWAEKVCSTARLGDEHSKEGRGIGPGRRVGGPSDSRGGGVAMVGFVSGGKAGRASIPLGSSRGRTARRDWVRFGDEGRGGSHGRLGSFWEWGQAAARVGWVRFGTAAREVIGFVSGVRRRGIGFVSGFGFREFGGGALGSFREAGGRVVGFVSGGSSGVGFVLANVMRGGIKLPIS